MRTTESTQHLYKQTERKLTNYTTISDTLNLELK